MSKIIAAFILGVSGFVAMAQTPAPVASTIAPLNVANPNHPTEELSVTERLAVGQVAKELQTARQDLFAVEQDISRNHPGFHLDENTGALVANPTAAPVTGSVPAPAIGAIGPKK